MKNFLFKHLFLTLISFFLTYSYSFGQDTPSSTCGANVDFSQLPKQEIDQNLMNKVQKIIAEKKLNLKKASLEHQEKANNSAILNCFTIPYIVHVLHDTNESIGQGTNVSNMQIQSQIDFFNDFFAQNNFNIEFLPALYDENNNTLSEPGVNRIELTDPDMVGGEFDLSFAKDIVVPMYGWNTQEYFNIFLFKEIIGPNCGFAFFPQAPNLRAIDNSPNELDFTDVDASIQDGISIESRLFTSTAFGGPAPPTNGCQESYTALHELGHWLGLRHISGDAFSCSRDDECTDTPSSYLNASVCNSTVEYCSNGIFPSTNIMTDNHGCYDEFTDCQFGRMLQTLQVDPLRSLLVESNKAGNQSICNNCNLDVSMTGLPAYTSSSSPITLTGSPSGGTFSGTGVIFNAFNPSMAGAGFHDITYTYDDGNGCSYTVTERILVFTITYNFVNYNLGTIAPRIGFDNPLPVLNDASLLVLKTNTPSIINVSVADALNGNEVFNTSLEAQKGIQYTGIRPMEGLRNGVYLITIRNNEEVVTKKGYKL